MTLSKTNINRALRGEALVQRHIELLEEVDDEIRDHCVIASLLTDIMHLCNKEDIEFEEAKTLAKLHFDAEIKGCDDYMDGEIDD